MSERKSMIDHDLYPETTLLLTDLKVPQESTPESGLLDNKNDDSEESNQPRLVPDNS